MIPVSKEPVSPPPDLQKDNEGNVKIKESKIDKFIKAVDAFKAGASSLFGEAKKIAGRAWKIINPPPTITTTTITNNKLEEVDKTKVMAKKNLGINPNNKPETSNITSNIDIDELNSWMSDFQKNLEIMEKSDTTEDGGDDLLKEIQKKLAENENSESVDKDAETSEDTSK